MYQVQQLAESLNGNNYRTFASFFTYNVSVLAAISITVYIPAFI